VSCDVPVWVASPDVGTAGDDVGSLAVASPLLPPPAPLATSAWSASISARSFCSSTLLRRTSISAFSSCISFSLLLSALSLSLLTRSPQCFDQLDLTCLAFSHLYRLALAALTNRRRTGFKTLVYKGVHAAGAGRRGVDSRRWHRTLSCIIQPSSGSSWRFMQGSNRRNKPPIPPAECPLIPYT